MTLRIDVNTSGVVRAEKTIDRSFDKMVDSISALDRNIQRLEKTFSSSMRSNTQEVKKFAKTTQRELSGVSKAFNGFLKTVKSAAVGYATVLATMELQQFISGTFEAMIAVDSLERSFKAITGSTEEAAFELQYINDTAKQLGLNLPVLEKSYKDILAASKGTTLEGENVRNVFTAIAKASAVLGMSADDTQGSLRALSQMISKGNVQAEELRGQLGERLPGAFQMAAEAMGVSTMKLNDMLENGEVLAQDLLPRLAEVLEKRFGEAAEDAGDRAAASFENLRTAITELQRSLVSTGILGNFTDLANDTRRWIEANNELLKQDLSKIFNGIAIAGRSALVIVSGLANKMEQIGNAAGYLAEKMIDVPTPVELATKQLQKLREELTKAQTGFFLPFQNKAKKQERINDLKRQIDFQKKVIDTLKQREKIQKEIDDPFAGLGGIAQSFLTGANIVSEDAPAEVSKKIEALFDAVGMTWEEREEKFWKDVEENQKRREKLRDPLGLDEWERDQLFWKKVEKEYADTEKALDSFFNELEQMEGAPTAFDEYLESLDKALNTTEILEDATIKAFKSMEDALVDFVMTGELEWKKYATMAIAEITRIAVKSAVIQPLAQGFNNFDGMGFLSSAASFMGFANGGIGSGSISAASNSIVSKPTFFPNTSVKGLATGGVAVGEGKRQEAVLPLERVGGDLGVKASIGQPTVNISIENNASERVEVSTTEPIMDDRGQLTIGVIVNAINTNQAGMKDLIRNVANQR